MNTGQLLLTIGAMFILSMVILRVNNNFLTTNDVMLNSKIGITAVSLGTSIIEEASSKSFDEVTSDTTILSLTTNDLTLSNNLGVEGAEVYPYFNDFDDFDDLNITESIPYTADFNITCKVYYVDFNPSSTSTDKIIFSSNRTWFKKLEVNVTNKSMQRPDGTPDTLKFYSVFSYWK